jgi:MtfA peptidase
LWARRRAAARPLTEEQRAVLTREMPFLATMPEEDKARFHAHIQMFLAGKRFEGVGIEVTDEMRLLIAACAARLSRNIGFSIYDGIGSVILYPEAVLVPRRAAGPSGFDVAETTTAAHGVHSSAGAVVLSWAAVKAGLRNPHDGHDTALHEFAHALDAADGGYDGTPPMSRRASREWARVFSEHFLALAKAPHKNVLDAYGATNEAEFFAVATETFFEKPNAMRRRAPALYGALRDFFHVDPAEQGG